MSFLKRLSRGSRSSSYVDDGYDSPTHSPSHAGPKSAFDRYLDSNTAAGATAGARPQSQGRRLSNSQHNEHSAEQLGQSRGDHHDDHIDQGHDDADDDDAAAATMYASRGQPEAYAPQGSHSRAVSGATTLQNGNGGMSHSALPDRPLDGMGGLPPKQQQQGFETVNAPDMLTQAFNMAIRPYHEKIEDLEAEVQELRDHIATLENERRDVHAWIDKRGLRPDVPPSIAAAMDSSASSSAPGQAAATLSAQLDRKITIVNFDLHRLQDDLNDSISTSHFASSMLKFLPEISRLSNLQQGPRYAFDLILKLGGNLNSHGLGSSGGGGSGDASAAEEAEESAARRNFFTRLDDRMVDVVDGRFKEGEDWQVAKEVRRLEKTAAYLRNFGVEPYFPRTLELMKAELGHATGAGASAGAGTGYPSEGTHSANASGQLNGTSFGQSVS